jgi:hypothetical protein
MIDPAGRGAAITAPPGISRLAAMARTMRGSRTCSTQSDTKIGGTQPSRVSLEQG